MGNAVTQGRGNRVELTPEEQQKAFTFPDGLDLDAGKLSAKCLGLYSVLDPADPDKVVVQEKLFGDGLNPQEDRAVGSLLALAAGDSLGAPLEFKAVDYTSDVLKGLDHEEIWKHPQFNRFGLEPGQWTDDASMSLCIADSLLVNQGFSPRDLRLRFVNWWRYGYNNAFLGTSSSVGLGGNISDSMQEFLEHHTEYTTAGNLQTSGNGSLMRLAPVPIYYWDNIDASLDVAYKQSKTTHQGEEAAEACQLAAYIISTAIKTGGTKEQVLDDMMNNFKPKHYSVSCLAKSMKEERHKDNEGAKLEDRDWRWKSDKYYYSKSRAEQQPGYIGSYAMDGLCMALHCLWTTDNLKDCMLKAANMRGDADTVCAIAGQMAGAIYGASAIPKSWITAVQKWDRGGEIALRAYKLFHKLPLKK